MAEPATCGGDRRSLALLFDLLATPDGMTAGIGEFAEANSGAATTLARYAAFRGASEQGTKSRHPAAFKRIVLCAPTRLRSDTSD